MSDIGRLYSWRRGSTTQEAIENYTSAALAIAIEHDETPMVRALTYINWSVSAAAPFDAASVTHVKARPQRHLPAIEGAREGYLDLVLDLTYASGETATAWVEAKVESPESGDQLDVYAKHAVRLDSPSLPR